MYPPLSPILLGVLALHGRTPNIVGVYGDLQTPSRVLPIDPDTVALVPPERVGLWLAESTTKNSLFSLIVTLTGRVYLRHGSDRTWFRVAEDCDLTAHLPPGFLRDTRMEAFLTARETAATPDYPFPEDPRR